MRAGSGARVGRRHRQDAEQQHFVGVVARRQVKLFDHFRCRQIGLAKSGAPHRAERPHIAARGPHQEPIDTIVRLHPIGQQHQRLGAEPTAGQAPFGQPDVELDDVVQ